MTRFFNVFMAPSLLGTQRKDAPTERQVASFLLKLCVLQQFTGFNTQPFGNLKQIH